MIAIANEPNDRDLRRKLDEITALPSDQVGRHPQLVAQLCASHPHSIQPALDSEVDHVPVESYTCFMHAFGIADSDAVIRIAGALDVYPSREFVAYLIDNHLSGTEAEGARDGDIVVYSDVEEIKHAGRVRSDRIVSKWGTGQLWEHRLFEVPARYREIVKFYRGIPRVVAEEAFLTYARQLAGSDLIEQLLQD